VPGRTNDFQELITLLVQTIGEDRATPSAMVRSKVPGVGKREVDIRVEAEVDGHPIYIGIEVSASKSRKKTVEWVERMQGKHTHLSTSKLVLVSSSGFTKAGLALAAHYGIDAITPGEVTPGFVGEIVNNLKSFWLERLDFTAEETTVYFDPPIDSPEGPLDHFTFPREAWGVHVGTADESVASSVGEMVGAALHNLDLSKGNLHDLAPGEGVPFNSEHDGPVTIAGEPLFLRGGSGVEPHSLRRITKVDIGGKLNKAGIEMPLQHGEFDGSHYSNGAVVLGDHKFHSAVVEGEDGPRFGMRVAPVDKPLDARSYRGRGSGKKLVIVPEGSSDT